MANDEDCVFLAAAHGERRNGVSAALEWREDDLVTREGIRGAWSVPGDGEGSGSGFKNKLLLSLMMMTNF